MKESIIQRSILDWLELYSRTENIYYFRAGSGKIRITQNRYFSSGKPGVPDILVCFGSRFIGMEVKNEKGRQSKIQKVAEKEIKEAGGEYYIVRSISDVKKILAKQEQTI